MGLWDEIIGFITSGKIFELPTIPVMIFSFIVGLVLGFVLKKTIKILIIVALIAIVAAYFGVLGLSFDKLKSAVETYGPQVAQYVAILVGALPLGLGFLIGFLLGFLVA
ncbi:MAG: FUN14 domain-containing protein [Thermoproteota archaeon]